MPKLSLRGKLLLAYFGILAFVGMCSFTPAHAGDLAVNLQWAVNGMPDTGGFRLHVKTPTSPDWFVAWETQDVTLRKADVVISGVTTGVTEFYFTSFTGSGSNLVESEKSRVSTYEYIEAETPSGPPVPTVIIKFGAATAGTGQ